jgi:signal transduction histidine kinase
MSAVPTESKPLPPASAVAAAPAAVPRDAHRGKLFHKYLLLILTLVSLALLVSGGISVYFTYRETTAALASLQREKAIGAASRIEEYLRQVTQQLQYAALPQMGAGDLELRRIEFLKLIRQAPEVTDISLIGADGRELIAESRLGMSALASGRDRSAEAAFQQAQRGQPWFGPVYFRKETEPYMTVAIRSGGEKPLLTVAELNLKFIWDVVSRIKIGDKGKAYVVGRDGYLVADPDIGLVLRKTQMGALQHVRDMTVASGDDVPALQSHDLAGTRVLVSMAPIETLGWRVFVEQPVSEVYARLNASILWTGGLLLAGLAVSALAAGALARSMVRPIRTLDDGARRIGAGDLEQQIVVRTGDELEGLAEQFNRMTAQLRESYAGLERKVEVRTAELSEALQQQTATADILRVISESPTDVQPVFDAIVRSGIRLFQGAAVAVSRPEGGEVRAMAIAEDDPQRAARWRQVFPFPLSRDYIHGAAILDCRVVDVPDLLETGGQFEAGKRNVAPAGYRAMTVVPMVREGVAIGAIAVIRAAPGALTDKQVALLKTFADQAVIAIENVRLFNETTEALEHQTATGEVLQVISGSMADATPVFGKILDACERLFGATDLGVFLVGAGERLHAGASRGGFADWVPQTYPRALAGTMSERVMRHGRLMHWDDLSAAGDVPDYIAEVVRARGNFSVAVAPLMWEGRGIGTLDLMRKPPRAWSAKELALIDTFADQAVVAIQNARLFNETKEALEHQTATAEVLQVISSSVADTQPVFDKILQSCERLFAGDEVGILLAGDDGMLHFGAQGGANPYVGMRELLPAPLEGSATALAIHEKRVLHYPQVLADPAAPPVLRRLALGRGFDYSLAMAPMIWEGRGVGSVFVTHAPPGPFSAKDLELLKTFADQAVIAIQNARQFREIQDKSRQLEIANQHKSEFLANMSHELRTPLNAIIGFSEVLIERMFGDLNDKQDDYLKDIHSSGKHLLSLINDILDLSKIEAGRMELDVESFDVPAALSNAMTLVRERAQRHGLALDLAVAPEVGEVRADERKFKQIMLNLLTNAVKFTPDGGKVAVSARLVGGVLEVAVTDTGIGIAPQDQAAVFEEFRQVGRHYTNKQEGTGLGLALTKRFVELHGGALVLDSEPGRGSTFTFTLPSQS